MEAYAVIKYNIIWKANSQTLNKNGYIFTLLKIST